MKKFYFYALVIACFFVSATIQAQDRYWIRAADNPGNWNDNSNWSTTPGGGGGASVPNSGANAFFPNGGTVNVDVASITLGRLTASGGTTRLIANAATTITVQSSTLNNEGLRIESGATLECRTTANVPFSITFANGADGVVNGTWEFTGLNATGTNGATFTVPGTSGTGTTLNINGTVIFRNFSRIPSPGAALGSEYIFFNNGSVFELARNGGGTPQATWAAGSTILVTGATTTAPSINVGTSNNIGNLTWNCPGMSPPAGSFELSLNGLNIQGNLSILNTNGEALTLLSGATPTVEVTVGGDLVISGNSLVYIGEDDDKSYRLNVNGNYVQTGGQFMMQYADNVGANTTELHVRGNFNHTDGTFGLASSAVDNVNELFVVELDGTAAQTVISTGTYDDPNGMITLRLNNANGASLGSPVTFGKISWNSANKGILTTTTTNVLTISNTDATAANVVNAPAANGYVSGPVRRLTASTDPYLFPTGKGGFLRPATIIPSSSVASVYTAEHFHTTPPSPGSVLNPLDGVTNVEYWSISRQSGSSAAIQLSWSGGAIPGADATDGVVVATFNGTNWVSVKNVEGTVFTPGNAGAGTVRSGELPAFNALFTFGFGPANALPVDLVSFTGKKLSSTTAQLDWTVTASSTPDRFEVLRSTDGNNFSTVGIVNAVNLKTKYSFIDNTLPVGTIYYRLRMIDVNGEQKLSKVIVISNGTDGLFLTSMWPTVVTNGNAQLSVSSSQRGSLQLVITDMYGRIVKQQINSVDAGSQSIRLDLHTLPGGAYQVTGYMDGKRSATIRFVVQR
jgi:hypothetical protein